VYCTKTKTWFRMRQILANQLIPFYIGSPLFFKSYRCDRRFSKNQRGFGVHYFGPNLSFKVIISKSFLWECPLRCIVLYTWHYYWLTGQVPKCSWQSLCQDPRHSQSAAEYASTCPKGWSATPITILSHTGNIIFSAYNYLSYVFKNSKIYILNRQGHEIFESLGTFPKYQL
jgi:hypothetical protein